MSTTQTCVLCGEPLEDSAITYCPECHPLEEARQSTQPCTETYDPETGEFNPDGIEGVDWEWEEQDDGTDEPEPDTYDYAALHLCTNHTYGGVASTHTGYSHAVTYCQEDRFGRLWMFDKSGRRGTQARYCPFCGFQALDSSAPDKPVHIVPADCALTPPDKPTAVWVHYRQRIMMTHFQFGTVKILASDGCHSKVLTQAGVQMTVCVENLSPLRGEPMLPKFGKKDDGPPKRKRGDVDPELMAKYLDMGR